MDRPPWGSKRKEEEGGGGRRRRIDLSLLVEDGLGLSTEASLLLVITALPLSVL